MAFKITFRLTFSKTLNHIENRKKKKDVSEIKDLFMQLVAMTTRVNGSHSKY